MQVIVNQIESIEYIDVLPEYLSIKWTYQYVMSLDKSLSEREAKRVLKSAQMLFDENQGINRNILFNLIKGVQSGLL